MVCGYEISMIPSALIPGMRSDCANGLSSCVALLSFVSQVRVVTLGCGVLLRQHHYVARYSRVPRIRRSMEDSDNGRN